MDVHLVDGPYQLFPHYYALPSARVAALHRSNICRLYHVGPDYLVMVFRGQDLRGPMD